MIYTYVGIDPGAEGHISLLRAGKLIWHYPIDNSFQTLHYAFREFETHGAPHRLLMEEPLTFTPKGAGGNRKASGQAQRQQAYGVMWGLAMGMGFSSVRGLHPSTWRAYYKFPRKTDKKVHIARAKLLFPDASEFIDNPTDGFADSLLIAHYASQVWDTKYIRSKR